MSTVLCRPAPLSPLPRRLGRALLSWFARTVFRVESADRAALNHRAEVLLDQYGDRVLRLAYSYLHNQSDAEVVLQDTFLQYHRTAPELEGPEHEKA